MDHGFGFASPSFTANFLVSLKFLTLQSGTVVVFEILPVWMYAQHFFASRSIIIIVHNFPSCPGLDGPGPVDVLRPGCIPRPRTA